MKRGTPDHPKTLMLAALLKVNRAQAVGHIELMFHFAADYAKDGAIGKWPDSMIAQKCGWDGEPETFMAALAGARGSSNAGWIDADTVHRWIIHDWSEHADDAVQKYLAEHGLRFADGSKPKRKMQVATQSQLVATQSACLAIALPMPCHSHSQCLAKWREWVAWRLKHGKRVRDWMDLFTRQARQIGRWAETHGIDAVIKSMDASMTNGWQGLFEPRTTQRPGSAMVKASRFSSRGRQHHQDDAGDQIPGLAGSRPPPRRDRETSGVLAAADGRTA